MIDLPGLFTISLVLLMTLFLMSRSPDITRIIFSAFIIRILFLLINNYIFPLPDSQMDAGQGGKGHGALSRRCATCVLTRDSRPSCALNVLSSECECSNLARAGDAASLADYVALLVDTGASHLRVLHGASQCVKVTTKRVAEVLLLWLTHRSCHT